MKEELVFTIGYILVCVVAGLLCLATLSIVPLTLLTWLPFLPWLLPLIYLIVYIHVTKRSKKKALVGFLVGFTAVFLVTYFFIRPQAIEPIKEELYKEFSNYPRSLVEKTLAPIIRELELGALQACLFLSMLGGQLGILFSISFKKKEKSS